MKTDKLKLMFWILIGLPFLISSCEIIPFLPKPSVPDKYNPNELKFDIDQFEANIVSSLGNQWVGYSYIINNEGDLAKSGTFGNWKQGRETKPTDLTSPIYLASIDKAIGTTSLIIALRTYGTGLISMLDLPIGPYLPPVLGASQQVRSLSFRNLLTHRTGFPQTVDGSLANMKILASSNSVSNNQSFSYSNANFFFIKYIIFQMANQNLLGLNTESGQQAKIKQFYSSFLQTRIFTPTGITSAISESNSVLGYRVGDLPTVEGWDIGDVSDMLGSGGLYMSTLDIARFQAFLNNSQVLLSKLERTTMYLNYLGWGDINPFTSPIVGTQGTYFSKQGSYINGSGQGVRTIIMTFPKNKIEIVFLANGRGGNLDSTNSLNTLFRNAYDNAWN
ncbi:serine hydrolase [Algoriphagus sp.]|uniref:serine hydrolase domain-containing protein n=1 Tax=Algoriphagus sp. TaxID=1872435 RepID=UPI0025FFD644|nr:serine hydrolase [Algoriphagus sp.]